MRVVQVDDPADPRLAPYGGVRDPNRLRTNGQLIVEGRLVVRRLLALGSVAFRSFLVNAAAFRSLADVLEPSDFDVYVVSADTIVAVTGFDIHRGCLALADRPPLQDVTSLIARSQIVLVVERVADLDNVGALFRNAEAFGADAVLLGPGCADPLYRKALRTSSGAALMVPFAVVESWAATLDHMKHSGFTVVAMTPRQDATDINVFADSPAARGRLALMVGAEGDGLTDDALASADVRVRIPMRQTLDSLNVAMAAGVALHRLGRAAGVA